LNSQGILRRLAFPTPDGEESRSGALATAKSLSPGAPFGSIVRPAMRGVHDIGGLPDGAIDKGQHDYALWEKRVDALNVLLWRKGLSRVDEHRRAIESLGADVYAKLTYYERWIAATAASMIEKGIIPVDELGRRMAEIEARAEPGAKR
jgi:hypothetical protein